MADAASPHYQTARDQSQSADDKVVDEKLANEAGIESLDGEQNHTHTHLTVSHAGADDNIAVCLQIYSCFCANSFPLGFDWRSI